MIVGAALASAGGGCRSESDRTTKSFGPPPRPNIIFIVVDTLRADGLGAYGNPRGNSPTVDSIAAEGVVIERAIASSPWTQPSIASLFSSRYPGVHQVLDYAQAYRGAIENRPKVAVFEDAFVTLAECMQVAGYETAAFVANPFIDAEFGFAQGFDHFDSSFSGNTVSADVVNREALTWLEQRDENKPLFLLLHYMDPHGPYDTAPEFLNPLLDWVEKLDQKQTLNPSQIERLGYLFQLPEQTQDPARHEALASYREYWVARYESGIRQFDHHLASLRRRLEDAGIWRDAYVVFTSDHGEALGEHGHWGHGRSMQHTELHIPLILRWPNMLPANVRVREYVELIDIMPTLLDQLAIETPAGLQGESIRKRLIGDGQAWSQVAFAEAIRSNEEQKALYAGHFKLIMHERLRAYRFFDIAADPGEQNQCLAEHRDQARAMAATLNQILERNAELARRRQPETIPLSDERIEQLRSLGYVE